MQIGDWQSLIIQFITELSGQKEILWLVKIYFFFLSGGTKCQQGRYDKTDVAHMLEEEVQGFIQNAPILI